VCVCKLLKLLRIAVPVVFFLNACLNNATNVVNTNSRFIADNQLRDYMLANEVAAAAGNPKLKLLNTGLWKYSRCVKIQFRFQPLSLFVHIVHNLDIDTLTVTG
jgi:hypothetical protein